MRLTTEKKNGRFGSVGKDRASIQVGGSPTVLLAVGQRIDLPPSKPGPKLLARPCLPGFFLFRKRTKARFECFLGSAHPGEIMFAAGVHVGLSSPRTRQNGLQPGRDLSNLKTRNYFILRLRSDCVAFLGSPNSSADLFADAVYVVQYRQHCFSIASTKLPFSPRRKATNAS